MRALGPIVVAIAFLAPAMPLADATSLVVEAQNFRWTPAFLAIDVGDDVTFTNASSTPHTWVRDDGSDSCGLPCTRTFAQPGMADYHCGVHPSMRATLQVGPGIALTLTSHAPGQAVGGLVHLAGRASHPTDAITGVDVALGTGPAAGAELDGASNDVAWSFDLDTTGAVEGPHDLTIVARTATGYRATLTIPIVIDNPDRIDIQMLSVSAPAGATTVSTVSYTLRNDGNAPTGTFRVRAEYLYQSEWHFIGERNQPSVAPGKNGLGSITWDPDGVLIGRFALRVTADPAGLLVDVDRANNDARGTGGWFTSALDGTDVTDPL